MMNQIPEIPLSFDFEGFCHRPLRRQVLRSKNRSLLFPRIQLPPTFKRAVEGRYIHAHIHRDLPQITILPPGATPECARSFLQYQINLPACRIGHTNASIKVEQPCGRFILPTEFYTALDTSYGEELLFIGRGGLFEIWNYDAWQKQAEREAENYDAVMDKIARHSSVIFTKPFVKGRFDRSIGAKKRVSVPPELCGSIGYEGVHVFPHGEYEQLTAIPKGIMLALLREEFQEMAGAALYTIAPYAQSFEINRDDRLDTRVSLPDEYLDVLGLSQGDTVSFVPHQDRSGAPYFSMWNPDSLRKPDAFPKP